MSYAQLSEDSDRDGSSSVGGGEHHRRNRRSSGDSSSMNGGGESSSASAAASGAIASIAGRMKSHNRGSLSEPLTKASGDGTNSNGMGNNNTTTTNNDAAGTVSDPFYVFREDLDRKIEIVDESLAEYLRIVHHTVRMEYFLA